jgi:pimeloyl-ACP methyl ester carboxylesterase
MKQKINLIFAMILVFALLITTVPNLITQTQVSALTSNWTLTQYARAIKAYPDLEEYVWQKDALMQPNGPYDKIGLHRLVNTDTTTKGVVLMLPGTYLSGEGWISNPPTDNFTKTENDSQAMYLANRGFDVYALDYRTHFVPTNLNSTQLGFMASWGYDQWMSDINEAVNKVKEVSGVNTIFIAGFSFGGRVAMYYAAKYWQQDIKGIILLDGGTNIKNANPTNTYNLTALLKQENATSKWTLETPNLPGTAVPSGWLFQKQFAAQNPGAPAEYPPGKPLVPLVNPINGKPWANITEYSAYMMNGPSANISGGFTNVTVLSQAYADMDRYWPDRLNLEANAINDWTNCPDVTYDFNEYYSSIDLPIISFTSELFGLPRGNGALINTTNLDTTRTVLLGYGHMDVYCGVNSTRDVSEPVYQWMVNHSLQTNPYTDPTALAWNVDSSFSFMDMIKANHTYVPADKVANPVQKLTISYDEKPLTCDIKVGGVTYSLGKDFTYTGHVDYIYYNPSFNSPTLGYYYPSSFSGTETTVNYMYNFSAIPGGLEGTLSMLATMKDAAGSIVSTRGTGDFKNVQVKATVSPQWYDAAKMVVNIYHDGMVSGWPNAVPTFYTTNTIVTYAQLSDYCLNVWGLQSNPYPAYPANVRSEYRIFNVVIGDKFYLGVSCSSGTSSVYDPVAKTVGLTYNATWYLGDWYRGVAKMDQGFTGTMVVTLVNYTAANATATPPTSATYDIGPALWNLQGFGALSEQSMMLRADGPVQPYIAKGYAILP